MGSEPAAKRQYLLIYHAVSAVWLKAVKAAAGACMAIALAMAMGLAYPTSAGIITLLSLQGRCGG